MTVTTRPTRRTRSTRQRQDEGTGLRGWLWATGQLALLGTELLALLLLLAYPGFRPRQLEVVGLQHLGHAEVASTLAIPADRSIFLLDHSMLEARLRAVPWVQSARVTLTLPDTVVVRIDEWTPQAILQDGERAYYLSAQGRILGPAPEAGSLPLVERTHVTSTQPGSAVLSAELEAMLVPLSRGFSAAYHVRAVAFTLDDRENLTIKTDRGFVIYFGQMATADQRATLEAKLGALKALGSRVDLVTAPIQYVNLMNAAAPAVQLRSGK